MKILLSLIAVDLFRQMAEHTAPECAKCSVPHSCCDRLYCEIAQEFALTQGEVLPSTDHPTLLFMGPNGCTVPPHLRPLCTLHTCAINSFGFKPNDPEWTERYFKLRNDIEREISKTSTLKKL